MTFPFMRLPAELRCEVDEHLHRNKYRWVGTEPRGGKSYLKHNCLYTVFVVPIPILLVSRQITTEAQKATRDLNERFPASLVCLEQPDS